MRQENTCRDRSGALIFAKGAQSDLTSPHKLAVVEAAPWQNLPSSSRKAPSCRCRNARYLCDITGEAIFKLHSSGVDAQIESYHPHLRVDFRAGKILQSLKCNVVLWLLDLNIITQSNQILTHGLK